MIKVRDLKFKYSSSKQLFDNMNLEFKSGKIYGLVGKNGSGKTTLLNILSGLIASYKGSVEIDGVSSKKRNREYLKKFFYIPENMFEFDYRLKDFITTGESYPEFDENKFKELISMEDELSLDKKFINLSKGWRKRVYIYYGLSLNTDILLLDEVSEGIDIIAQKQLIKYLLEYFDDDKIIIISSHHIEEFEKIIDEFVIVKDGKVLYKDQKDIIQSNYGIVEEDEKETIEKEDILKEEKSMGRKFYIIKNREKYKNIKVKNIDTKDFIEFIINNGGVK